MAKLIDDGSSCAIVVAHPDDETLWAGGLILAHPNVQWKIVTLCRESDPDRAPKFYKALQKLGATGKMADLDDGPEQNPLNYNTVWKTIVALLEPATFDLIITHGVYGEYTRHLRHEEVSRAVTSLHRTEMLPSERVWLFAYDDDDGKHLPSASADADIQLDLSEDIWQQKYDIITDTYSFAPDSFEARTTPRREAFWELKDKHI